PVVAAGRNWWSNENERQIADAENSRFFLDRADDRRGDHRHYRRLCLSRLSGPCAEDPAKCRPGRSDGTGTMDGAALYRQLHLSGWCQCAHAALYGVAPYWNGVLRYQLQRYGTGEHLSAPGGAAGRPVRPLLRDPDPQPAGNQGI